MQSWYAYANGSCQGVSGCGWVVDGVDYSDAFFDSWSDCEEACTDIDELTCSEIEIEYQDIHSGEYDNCIEDSDCVTIWGDCDVGLGGCHYSVNNELFDSLVQDTNYIKPVITIMGEYNDEQQPLPFVIYSTDSLKLDILLKASILIDSTIIGGN